MRGYQYMYLIKLFACLIWLFSTKTVAQVYELDKTESHLIVITSSAGVLKPLGVNHLFAINSYKYMVSVDFNRLEQSEFVLTIPVTKISLYEHELSDKLLFRLRYRGFLSHQPKPFLPDDKAAILNFMLSGSQLDAQDYPEIRLKINKLVLKKKYKKNSKQKQKFYDALVDLTIKDKTHTQKFDTALTLHPGRKVQVESYGKVDIINYGIRPFEIFFGLLQMHRNISVYANLLFVPK